MPFLTPLVARTAFGSKWALTEPLVYQAGAGELITIPRGFTCDLASIPRIFQLLIPVNDAHREAATLHDWLYTNQGEIDPAQKALTREQCDLIFLTAMRESGVPRWKRYSMFIAVRVGGFLAWNS